MQILDLGLKAAAQKTVRNTRKEKIVATFVDTSKGLKPDNDK